MPYKNSPCRVFFWPLVLVVAAVGCLSLAGKFDRENIHKKLTEAVQRADGVALELKQNQKKLEELSEKIASVKERVSKSSETRSKNAVVERFDAKTGRLVERKTTHTAAAREVQKHTKEEVVSQREVKSDTTSSTALAVKAHSSESVVKTEVTQPADVRMGVTAGVLLTAAGAGPSLSYALASRGPLHVDAIASVLRGAEGLSPRAGVSAVAELTPRLSAGAALTLAPAGDPLGIYHPLFPWAGVSPGLTVGYRF
jgi:hypothetical protein